MSVQLPVIPWKRPTQEQHALWSLTLELMDELRDGLAEGWVSPVLLVLDQEQKEIWRAVFAEAVGQGSDHDLAEAVEQKAPEGALFGLTRIDGERPRLLVWSQARANSVTVDLDLSEAGDLLAMPRTGELDQAPRTEGRQLPVVRSAEELFAALD